jgi:CHAD domain-containing protein
MHSLFQQYFAIRVKNLFNHLHDLELIDPEIPLHDLRVEIKKVKSIIKFLKTIYPKEKFKKSSYQLNHIFQHAGEIREQQIIRNWLVKNNAEVIVERYFSDKKIAKLVSSFQKQSDTIKTTLKEISDRCNKYISITNEITIEQYVKKLNHKIEKEILRSEDKHNWHELRKSIKQWIYSRSWLDEDTKESSASVFSKYNKLQEAIGAWHDLEMIKEYLFQENIHLSAEMDLLIVFERIQSSLNREIKSSETKVIKILLSFHQ